MSNRSLCVRSQKKVAHPRVFPFDLIGPSFIGKRKTYEHAPFSTIQASFLPPDWSNILFLKCMVICLIIAFVTYLRKGRKILGGCAKVPVILIFNLLHGILSSSRLRIRLVIFCCKTKQLLGWDWATVILFSIYNTVNGGCICGPHQSHYLVSGRYNALCRG